MRLLTAALALLLALPLATPVGAVLVAGGQELRIDPTLRALQDAWIAEANATLQEFRGRCGCPPQESELLAIVDGALAANAGHNHTIALRLLSLFAAMELYFRLSDEILRNGSARTSEDVRAAFLSAADGEQRATGASLAGARDRLAAASSGAGLSAAGLESLLLAGQAYAFAAAVSADYPAARDAVAAATGVEEAAVVRLLAAVAGPRPYLRASEALLAPTEQTPGPALDPARVRAAAERPLDALPPTGSPRELSVYADGSRRLRDAGAVLAAAAPAVLAREQAFLAELRSARANGTLKPLDLEADVRHALQDLSGLAALRAAGYDGTLVSDAYIPVVLAMAPAAVSLEDLVGARAALHRISDWQALMREAAGLADRAAPGEPLAGIVLVVAAAAACSASLPQRRRG